MLSKNQMICFADPSRCSGAYQNLHLISINGGMSPTGKQVTLSNPSLINCHMQVTEDYHDPGGSQGPKCFTDAAAIPDGHRWIQQGKQVGALIVGPEENLRVVVQAHAKECTSVLMAEATAMTFASRITISLQ